MDKSLKRYGNTSQNQGPSGNNLSGNGNNSRLFQGVGATGSPARLTTIQGQNSAANPSTSGPCGYHGYANSDQRSNNRNTVQTRGVNIRQPKSGRFSGTSKAGNQPHGLGAFNEMGLNSAEQGTRKHNYNHLLNFNYGQRGEQQSGRHGGSGGFNRRFGYNQYQTRYNKEQFLQATCKFVVKDSGDYTVHHVDPDVLVEWNKIELIKVYGHEVVTCPICLHPPVAAKITRCGHIYCWPCILHYLSLSDASYRKCPICYESIHQVDLRSVVAEVVEPVKIGSQITMRLMMRDKGSVWPCPVAESRGPSAKFFNVQDSNVLDYSKILLVRQDQVNSEILEREERELKFALETEGDNPESCFIETALKNLNNRREQNHKPKPELTKQPAVLPVSVRKPVQSNSPVKVYACAFTDEVVDIHLPGPSAEIDEEPKKKVENLGDDNGGISRSEAGDEGQSVGEVRIIRAESTESKDSGSCSKTSDSELKAGRTHPNDAHYFYQSADGQHIYLDHLNVRMLIAQYGRISAGPAEITAKVLDVESWNVTEEVRKRYRYLSHLPLTCVFNMVELDMKPPDVSCEILHNFENEANQRRHARQMKLQDELTRQQDAENAFRKDIRGHMSFSLQAELFPDMVASGSSEQLNITSDELFPVVGSEAPISPCTSSAVVASTSSANKSFAQMLREGKSQPHTRWSAAPPTSTALPNRFSSQTGSFSGSLLSKSSEEDDHDDYQPAPNFQASFSAGLDAAFNRLKVAGDKEESGDLVEKQQSKKKKNKKKVTLFTTGGGPRI